MKKPKGTKYVRVRLDFTVVLTEEIDFNAIVGPREADRLQLAVAAVLTGDPRVDGITPGTETSSALDFRPRDKDHRLTDGKAAQRRRGAR